VSWIITKYLITAGLVVLISELAKLNDKLGALIASLPLITLLTLFWLYFEDQPSIKIANHAFYTFWFVIPTLPMFLAFPFLLYKTGFWYAMGISVIITIACFLILLAVTRYFNLDLLS